MSIGQATTKVDVDARVASVVEQLWGSLRLASDLNSWMTDAALGGTDANLTALGYTSAEVTVLRAGVADIGSAAGLYGVAHGSTPPTATSGYAYLNRTKAWTGINFSG